MIPDSATLLSRAHSLEEFCAMFALTERERQLSILACGDAPASFNAEGTAAGMRIVSADPLYGLREAEMRSHVGGLDAAAPAHGLAIERFFSDFESGVAQGRYVTGNACELPFPDGSYDLALCAYALFAPGASDLAWHLRALQELTRVAEEVRLFPVLQSGSAHRQLQAVLMALRRNGLRPEWRDPAPGIQAAGTQVLVITR